MRPTDGPQAHAERLLRKLFALGLDETGIVALARSVATMPDANENRPASDSPSDNIACPRLPQAQYAIRQLMAAGFIKSDIAGMVGVSPGSISHIIEPESCRSVSPKLLGELERVLQTIGWERLKTLLPYIPVSVVDTCNSQDTEVGEAALAKIEEQLPRSLLRALIPGCKPMPAPEGIRGVLARVGNPRHEIYLMKLWSFVAGATPNEEIAHLQLLEHELDHVVNRIRARRVRLQNKTGTHVSHDRTSGKIA